MIAVAVLASVGLRTLRVVAAACTAGAEDTLNGSPSVRVTDPIPNPTRSSGAGAEGDTKLCTAAACVDGADIGDLDESVLACEFV